MTRVPPPGELRPVGRDRELAHLEAVVAAAPDGPRFVVISGDAGIGKTTLWRAAVSAHRAAGHLVLTTRPSEEELHGPLVGLFDLFASAAMEDEVLDPDLDVLERGRAVLRALRAMTAGASTVVVAVDDLQWLDAVSAHALRYAFRRLAAEPVVLVATRRPGSTGAPDVAPPTRIEELALGPLDASAMDEVVHRAVGAVPRPALGRIVELAEGNPLYAIELARRPHGVGGGLGPAAPATLTAAMATRLDALPGEVRRVVLTAAALGPAPAELLERACGGPGSAAAIGDAVERGLLVHGDEGLVRVAHPSLASVVLDGCNPLERRALHALLAGVVGDPDARARHLALSTSEPDPGVAAELASAADRAGRRGAAAVAAELADHSVRLTPASDRDDSTRRSLAAISFRAAAGEPERASALADDLLARLEPAAPARLEALTLRVFLDIDHGEDVLGRALAEVADDRWWRGRLLELLGWLLATYRGDLERGRSLGEEALAIALEDGDADLEMLASATVSTAALLSGRPRPGLVERAVELGEVHEPPRLGRWPPLFLARHCLWGGDLERARAVFESMRAAFSARGIEFQRPYRLSDLALVEVSAGRLDDAAALLDDALEAALDAGNRQAAVWRHYPAGLLAAHRGHRQDATTAATELTSWGRDHHQPPRRLMGQHLLGLEALARGDAAVAHAELDRALDLASELGYRHPGFVPVLPDAVEARALIGDDAGCRRLADEVAAQAIALGCPWVDAAAGRAHGLALLAAGDDGAAAVLAEAASAFDGLGYGLDAARTILLQGRSLRRAGRRGEAATVLADAEARFAAMDARPWSEQVAAEQERLVRAPGRDLTVTEQRVADLVVLGRRNREIAGELYVSVATVEAHLTRVYRKLGVRSRTELARLLSTRPGSGDAP